MPDNGFDQYKKLFLEKFEINDRQHKEIRDGQRELKKCVNDVKLSMARLEAKSSVSWKIHAWLIPALVAGAVALVVKFL
jgi:hypothetical protein